MTQAKLETPFAIGDRVIIDSGDVIGVVVSVLWSTEDPSFKVGWFHSGDHKEAWFPDWRLSDAEPE